MSFYRVRYLWGGSAVIGPSILTLNFNSAGGTAQQAATAAGNFVAALVPYLSANCNATLDTAIPTVDETTGKTSAVASVGSSFHVGLASGDFLPPHTQLLVRWRTGVFVDGREARGRSFIPGMTEANCSNGTPISQMQTDVANAGAALIADANSRLCIWSRSRPQDIPPFVGIVRDVATASVWNKMAVLRSRRD